MATKTATRKKSSTKKRITPKEAAIAASKYFTDITGRTSATLEEIELSEDENYWMITLGYQSGELDGTGNLFPEKRYKIFEINALTGEVISMKIREV